MKKIIAAILLISLILFVAGCGSSVSNETTVPETTVQTEPISDNPLIAAELLENFVLNGSGTDVIGKCAYIKISKSVLKSITEEEYAEFCEEVAGSVLYNWVSIICDDWTGIQFTGSQYTFATYGSINYMGEIIEDIGYIRQTETGFEYEACE